MDRQTSIEISQKLFRARRALDKTDRQTFPNRKARKTLIRNIALYTRTLRDFPAHG